MTGLRRNESEHDHEASRADDEKGSKEGKMKDHGWYTSTRLASTRAALLALSFAVAGGVALRAADGKIPVYQAGTISSAGYYYLTQDITTGSGITISAYNVTLDLNGHLLTSTGTGIDASSSNTNIRVTNGSVSASGNGVVLVLRSGGFGQVDQVRILEAHPFGISVQGPSGGTYAKAVVERNTIVNVTNGDGISLTYLGNALVRDNTISGVTGSNGYGVGLLFFYCHNGLFSGNVISTCGTAGLAVNISNGNQVTRNTLSSNGAEGISLSSSNNNSINWNTACANSGYGLFINGSGNIYAYNHTSGNTSGERNIGSGNTDGGGNIPFP